MRRYALSRTPRHQNRAFPPAKNRQEVSCGPKALHRPFRSHTLPPGPDNSFAAGHLDRVVPGRAALISRCPRSGHCSCSLFGDPVSQEQEVSLVGSSRVGILHGATAAQVASLALSAPTQTTSDFTFALHLRILDKGPMNFCAGQSGNQSFCRTSGESATVRTITAGSFGRIDASSPAGPSTRS